MGLRGDDPTVVGVGVVKYYVPQIKHPVFCGKHPERQYQVHTYLVGCRSFFRSPLLRLLKIIEFYVFDFDSIWCCFHGF